MREFNGGYIKVNEDFVRIGTKTYAVNKINTVDLKIVKKIGGWGILIGAVGLLALIGSMSTPSDPNAGSPVTVAIFMMIVGGIVWFVTRGYKCELFLITSSGSFLAWRSPNKDEITELRDTVEAAMAGKFVDERVRNRGLVPA